MQTYSENMQRFLSDDDGFLSQELLIAIIEMFGGEDGFVEKHEQVFYSASNKIKLPADTETELNLFFNENHDDIVKYLELSLTTEDYDSVGAMVADWDYFDGRLTARQVDKGIDSEQSKYRSELARACTHCVVQQATSQYHFFLLWR